jgi:8-oxo-dGTP pyrophosphatase MutT (NUDIX family)
MAAPDPAAIRRTGCDAVVFDDKGRVLLQKRSDFHVWGLPGGSVEVGETVAQAVRREVKEESGYDVEVVRLIGAYSDPELTTTKYPGGDVVHYVSLTFECRILGGSLRTDHESDGMAWFARDELPAELLRDHVPRLQDAFARQAAAFFR